MEKNMTSSRKYFLAIIVFAFAAVLIGVTRTGYAQTSPSSKIAPWVLEHTANGQSAEFLVVLTEQANLNAAAQLPDKVSKGSYVYNTLYRTAQTTQAPLLAWLKARGIEHRSYYIVNLIWVKADRETALALAARSDVARLDGNPTFRGIPDQPFGPANPGAPTGIEAGINYVKAPQVWSMGFTGQGIVVGGQDTGIQWDHPALKNHYRGWNGTTASHDYNWHDSIHSGGGVCGANSPVPCDDTDHGTHTMGTVVGDDGGPNQIGMAPGAKFIGCRNMNQGDGTPTTYLECFEFFLAPYPVSGTTAQGDPSKAPDVTNNSWGCPTSEGCTDVNVLLAAVQAQRAAGIMTVVSAGNAGSSCNTVNDPPGIYDEVYSVGALNTGSDSIASFSSRGAVTVDGSGRRKPDISAPGTSTRSSIPGGSYTTMSGTSMAGPHVAGAVALLWSARPALKNNIDLTEQALNDSAVHITNATCDPAGTTWPNNTYGYGRLDIKNAVDLTPAGDSYLVGTVTNANTATPIVGAMVTANATMTQTGSTATITGGQYSLLLMANTYTVTAAAYGYLPTQLTGIAVAAGTTTTQNITLTPAALYLVSGTVSEAATGAPLTGTITIAGYPGGPVSTNPGSGYYSVTLAEGRVYTFTVTSPGYVTVLRTVGPLTANRVEDFALNADLTLCTAPGYQYFGLNQAFDATVVPTGWLVINNVGTKGWSFNNPGGRSNLTGGTGNFAIADSDNAGSGVSMDTELRTPVLDLSTQTQVTLTFKTDFRIYSGGQAEVADVDVSTSGAAGPWTNVWRKTADYRGPKTETVNLTAIAGGQANVMLRFHYYNAVWEYWWQVDDVQMGQCKLQTTVNLPVLTPATAAQAGYPGTVVTYTLNLSNTDSVLHTFDVSIANNTWPTNAATSIGPVAAQAVQPFTVTVAIPGNAAAHSTDVATITVRAQDNLSLSAQAIVTTTAKALPIVSLEPAMATQAGNPGALVTYTLHISHTDVASRTFEITLMHNSWPTAVTTPIGPLPGNVAEPVTVTITIPTDTPAYSTDTVHIVASAQDGMIISNTALLTTTANFVPGIQLEPAHVTRTAQAGEWITHTLNLTNTGNFTDTFALDYTGNLWDAQGPLSATLAAGSGTPLFVAVHVPPTATNGLSDTAHLTITGSGVFAFSDLITTASRLYAVYLPLILK
jgi:subtilisin family serine protease